jgi:hypothetical protein
VHTDYLTSVVVLIAGVTFAFIAFRSLKTGRATGRGSIVNRSDSPITYFIVVASQLAIAVYFLYQTLKMGLSLLSR